MVQGPVTQRLEALGITLPEPASPVANYVPFMRVGSLLFISGQLPLVDGALRIRGKLAGTAETTPEGQDAVSLQAGEACARACFINILAQLRAAVGGDWQRVGRLVRLGGFIACTPDFTDHAKVMNGASDLAVEVFGEKGKHARAAVGAPSLPLDAPVEVEAVFELL